MILWKMVSSWYGVVHHLQVLETTHKIERLQALVRHCTVPATQTMLVLAFLDR